MPDSADANFPGSSGLNASSHPESASQSINPPQPQNQSLDTQHRSATGDPQVWSSKAESSIVDAEKPADLDDEPSSESDDDTAYDSPAEDVEQEPQANIPDVNMPIVPGEKLLPDESLSPPARNFIHSADLFRYPRRGGPRCRGTLPTRLHTTLADPPGTRSLALSHQINVRSRSRPLQKPQSQSILRHTVKITTDYNSDYTSVRISSHTLPSHAKLQNLSKISSCTTTSSRISKV